MAPLGHYVLADVYNRQGRVAEARAQQQAGDRLAGARATAASARSARARNERRHSGRLERTGQRTLGGSHAAPQTPR